MKGGGNITDISQYNGIKLITKYWSKINHTHGHENKAVIVGDVHGDLHQFIAPLVMNDIITLNGEINTIDNDIMYYVPSYIVNDCKCIVIYLGDITDEWIFSRTISYMMYNLLKNNKVRYIYGNHDLSIIGRYYLFKEGKLNIAVDIPPLWETLKKELNCNEHIKIIKDKVMYDNDEVKGIEYLYKYISPLFNNLYKIFTEQLGLISMVIAVNNIPYMISHCTWTKAAIKQLLKKQFIDEHANRPSDKNKEQLRPMIFNYRPNNNSLTYLRNIVNKMNDINFNISEQSDYIELSKAVNDVFKSKSRLYVSKNNITYSRNTDTIFLNHIVGHTIGSEWRDINVNIKQSTYYDERMSKLNPDIINDKHIYYFDFGCSAGYDHDEISRPDYVYIKDSEMFVSNLPAFSFITTISNDERIDSMLIMNDKTPHSKNKITFN